MFFMNANVKQGFLHSSSMQSRKGGKKVNFKISKRKAIIIFSLSEQDNLICVNWRKKMIDTIVLDTQIV